jgi:hypothetical protein
MGRDRPESALELAAAAAWSALALDLYNRSTLKQVQGLTQMLQEQKAAPR